MEPATKRRKISSESGVALQELKEEIEDQDKRQSLFVRSLPASVTKERLIEHFSQAYPLKHATVILDPTTKISRGFGFVTFTDAEDAQQALIDLNDSILDGRKIKIELAEARHREIQDSIGGRSSSKNVKGEELRAKRQLQHEENQPPKLIVRNLPWSIKNAEDLTKLFLSYGKVKHAVVPRLPAKNDAQAGFGIVIIRGKKNAERALQGVNGKVVDGRILAVDWAVDKETWQKVQSGELPQNNGEDDSQATDKPNESELQEISAESEDDEDNGLGVSINNEAQEEASADDSASETGDEDVDQSLDEADLSEDDISDLAANEESEATTTKFNTENTTVFIRNLPYDIDDESLSDHFNSNFGPVRYARVVYDHDTERSRGTAFVCFRHEADAKLCVTECPKQDHSSADKRPQSKHQQASILQDENADPTGKYTLNSRLLHVTRALPKKEADTRASESQKTRLAKQQSDKRRLYLLSEGTVSPSSSLYSSLSKSELDIRAASAKQRQKLVKSNPNLGLSLTRLSIRNLPRWIDGRALKALAREAIVGFASDVKAGLRHPISKEELARDGEAGRVAEKQRKEQGKGVVKQAKIVYESEKTGTKISEGKGGRSRGYGFVEYWGHRSALMGLRWLNGHTLKKPKDDDTDGERGKRLIVEFAIENAQVVQRRSEREKRVKQRKSKDTAAEDEVVKDDKDRKRKRSSGDDNSVVAVPKNKRQKSDAGSKESSLNTQDQDEKNKIAARNRIIAQKRQKRKGRKGRA